jgi:DNA repair protein RadD
MPPQVLREYQARGRARIYEAWKRGSRVLLLVLPTGGGKTTLFGLIVAELAAAGLPSLILVHRRELATQAANRLREFGVDFGFIMAGEPARPFAPVQIASVQTLAQRIARSDPTVMRFLSRVRLAVADEAHLSTAATWTKALDAVPRARVLGVTATPWRLGGKPLIGAYDEAIVVATPRELREAGYLCDYVGFSYKSPDLSEIETTGGDYNEQQSAKAMRAPAIVDNIVEQWLAHASDLSTVVFAVTVEHSQELCAKFLAAGVSAEHLDGATPKEKRAAILRRVERGETRVLCNVGVAVEGLDIPRLKCCVLARPTKSLARAIQMMGRVRRPWNGVVARIHDHAFVVRAHGLPDADRDYTLRAKAPRPEALFRCAECGAYAEVGPCLLCGAEPEAAPVGERVLATVPDAEQFQFDSATELPTEEEKPRPVTEVAWSDGKTVEGIFLGTETVEGRYGPRKVHVLQALKRDYRLPGYAHLDWQMAKVPLYAQTRVSQVGETGPVARRSRLFKVWVDREPAAQPGRSDEEELVRRYVINHELPKTIARDFGVSDDTISRRLKALGVLRTRGEAVAARSAPDPSLVERARAMVAAGSTQGDVAQALGVAQATIGRWLRRPGGDQ